MPNIKQRTKIVYIWNEFGKIMRKLFLQLSVLLIIFGVMFMSSCQKLYPNPYDYDVTKDTIAPVVAISVPLALSAHQYTYDIPIVGTVKDLESEKNDLLNPGFRAGKLKSVNIRVVDTTHGFIDILNLNPDVADKDAIAFNEKINQLSGPGATFRLIVSAEDMGGKTDKDTVYFSYY